MFEMQLKQVKEQMEALVAKHERDLDLARTMAAADKRAALTAQKKEFLAKYELVRSQLAAALELSIDGALSRIDEICVELKDFHAQASAQEIL
jgi:hypothetical protein